MAHALLRLGGGINMQPQGLQGAGAPGTGPDLRASSGQANQQAALLQILTLAKLAAQLPQPQPQFCAPAAAAPAAFVPPPQLAMPPAGAEASGTSSDRIALPMADATAELEAAPSVAGLKVGAQHARPCCRRQCRCLATTDLAALPCPDLAPPSPRIPPLLQLPVTCNDIRGVVYLDQQVVVSSPGACRRASCRRSSARQLPAHTNNLLAMGSTSSSSLPTNAPPPPCRRATARSASSAWRRGTAAPSSPSPALSGTAGPRLRSGACPSASTPAQSRKRPSVSHQRHSSRGGGQGRSWAALSSSQQSAQSPAPQHPSHCTRPSSCHPADEPPLALGQWLESKGLVSWAPRGGLKIGPSGGGGGMGSSGGCASWVGHKPCQARHPGQICSHAQVQSAACCPLSLPQATVCNPSQPIPARCLLPCADDEGSPLWGEDSGRRGGQERRLATIGPRQLAYAPNGATAAPTGSPLGKRSRQEYETPDLPSHADRQQWLAGQLVAFDAVAAAAAASSDDAGSGAAPAAAAEGGSEASGGPWTAALGAKHAAIFALVYGLLDEGEDRRCVRPCFERDPTALHGDAGPPRRLQLRFLRMWHSALRMRHSASGC